MGLWWSKPLEMSTFYSPETLNICALCGKWDFEGAIKGFEKER